MFLGEIPENKEIFSISGLFYCFECKMKRILNWSWPENELYGDLVPVGWVLFYCFLTVVHMPSFSACSSWLLLYFELNVWVSVNHKEINIRYIYPHINQKLEIYLFCFKHNLFFFTSSKWVDEALDSSILGFHCYYKIYQLSEREFYSWDRISIH